MNISGKLKGSLIAGLALTTLCGTANAVIWESDYNPDDIYLNAPASTSFTHSIIADGFLPGVDSITSASLTLWLYDDAFIDGILGDSKYWGDGYESVTFNYDGATSTTEVGGNVLFRDAFKFSVASLSDGLLDVTVTASSGDFWFDRSYLKVEGRQGGGVSVPEPGTLALFAVGLIGLGLGLRRRQSI